MHIVIPRAAMHKGKGKSKEMGAFGCNSLHIIHNYLVFLWDINASFKHQYLNNMVSIELLAKVWVDEMQSHFESILRLD
ncbi:MAG: hypothetical protein Q9M08_00715 [Mariprofundus sp.]|nr:hypothetical protein [Mariprofundus sp.]